PNDSANTKRSGFSRLNLGHRPRELSVSKAQSSPRYHPRKKAVRVSPGSDPWVLVGHLPYLFWRAPVDCQPSQIMVGRTEKRTRGSKERFLVKLGAVCHVGVLKRILVLFT